MENSKSVPAVPPIGQNEPPLPIGSETQAENQVLRASQRGMTIFSFPPVAYIIRNFVKRIALIVTYFPLSWLILRP